MPARYPVAVASTPTTEDCPAYVIAVCNDGSMWERLRCDRQWIHIKDIPQPGEEGGE